MISLIKAGMALMVILVFLPGLMAAQEQASLPQVQDLVRLTSAQWDEDLTYLVKRLEIMHPNLYANIERERFQSAVDGLRNKSRTCSDSDMAIAVMELLALLKDGHTRAIPISNRSDLAFSAFTIYPLLTYDFADGLFILAATRPNEALVGRKIVQIGRLPVAEALRRAGACISADNVQMVRNNLPRLLFIREALEYLQIKERGDGLKLTLEGPEGALSEVTVQPVPLMSVMQKLMMAGFPAAGGEMATMDEKSTAPLPLWLGRKEENYWFDWLPEERSVYLQIKTMVQNKHEAFSVFCSRLIAEVHRQKPERLIIDLRHNKGGNHIEMPLLQGIIERPWLNRPGKLFLLTGRMTFSAAQHLTTLLRRYTRVTLLGEPTAGKPNHYGNTSDFNLPHSGITITTSKVLHQDSYPEDFSITSEPDFFVPLTSADYVARRDPVLARLFAEKDCSGMRQQCLERMSDAYRRGGLERLVQTWREIKPAYDRFGFNPKMLLYDDLDPWMLENKRSDADYIAFLGFLHEQLPSSIEVCQDLASWLGSAGNHEAQASMYRECLRLNPAHRLARMALELAALEQGCPQK